MEPLPCRCRMVCASLPLTFQLSLVLQALAAACWGQGNKSQRVCRGLYTPGTIPCLRQ